MRGSDAGGKYEIHPQVSQILPNDCSKSAQVLNTDASQEHIQQAELRSFKAIRAARCEAWELRLLQPLEETLAPNPMIRRTSPC